MNKNLTLSIFLLTASTNSNIFSDEIARPHNIMPTETALELAKYEKERGIVNGRAEGFAGGVLLTTVILGVASLKSKAQIPATLFCLAGGIYGVIRLTKGHSKPAPEKTKQFGMYYSHTDQPNLEAAAPDRLGQTPPQ